MAECGAHWSWVTLACELHKLVLSLLGDVVCGAWAAPMPVCGLPCC